MLRQSFSLKKPSKSRRLSSCGWKVREIKLLTLRRCFVCVCVCVCVSLSLSLSRLRCIVSFAPRDFGSHGYRAYLHHDQARWRAERPGTPLLPFLFFFLFFFPFFLFFHLFVGSFWSYRNLADRCLVSGNLIDWLPFFRLIFFFPADLGLDRFLRV